MRTADDGISRDKTLRTIDECWVFQLLLFLRQIKCLLEMLDDHNVLFLCLHTIPMLTCELLCQIRCEEFFAFCFNFCIGTRISTIIWRIYHCSLIDKTRQWHRIFLWQIRQHLNFLQMLWATFFADELEKLLISFILLWHFGLAVQVRHVVFALNEVV